MRQSRQTARSRRSMCFPSLRTNVKYLKLVAQTHSLLFAAQFFFLLFFIHLFIALHSNRPTPLILTLLSPDIFSFSVRPLTSTRTKHSSSASLQPLKRSIQAMSSFCHGVALACRKIPGERIGGIHPAEVQHTAEKFQFPRCNRTQGKAVIQNAKTLTLRLLGQKKRAGTQQ